MDSIIVRDLRIEVLIGIHRREQHAPQTVSLDLDIGLPGETVFASDRVADTIDYEQVALRIKALAGSGHFRLVETLAERIARPLLDDFGAPWVKVGARRSPSRRRQVRQVVSIERRKADAARYPRGGALRAAPSSARARHAYRSASWRCGMAEQHLHDAQVGSAD
jgi:dihydroneopterin aldolase